MFVQFIYLLEFLQSIAYIIHGHKNDCTLRKARTCSLGEPDYALHCPDIPAVMETGIAKFNPAASPPLFSMLPKVVSPTTSPFSLQTRSSAAASD